MIPSLYIHIPFCRKRCLYCDFYSTIYDPKVAGRYIDTITKQIDGLDHRFDTVYVGGGTPSALDNATLARLLGSLKRCADSATEYTIEANPESLNEEKVKMLRSHGVNRLSIGVQSFSDKKLHRLGRIHDSKKSKDAIVLSRRNGFENISIDLIYGVWDERLKDWQAEIEEATSLPIEHISCYSLTYEKDTPIFNAVKDKDVMPLEDKVVGEMYGFTIERLSVRGFKQYEVSNFAKDDHRCRHNLNYWDNSPYIGIGASAVSYIDGVRSENVRSVEEYIERSASGGSLICSSEKLSPIKRAKETAAVKIRTKDGIDFDWFKDKTGFDFMELERGAVKELAGKELIKFKKDKDTVKGIYLRRKGFLYCDIASSALL